MTAGYHISVASPPGWRHTPLLTEIAELVQLSLASLGINAPVSVNRIASNVTNIIIGYHLVNDHSYLRAAPCIIYQLEQLSPSDARFAGEWIAHLRQASMVWDFSEQNIAMLRAHGVGNVRHVPFGYHPAMRRITHAAEKDIDVLFYGALNSRRQAVLEELGKHCKAEVMFGVYGAQRDAAIARAKIVLNVHLHEAMILEQARVSYLLNNGCFIVSEESRDNPYAAVVTAPYDRLVETCLEFLAKPDERERLAAAGAEAFTKMPMATHLAAALK